MDDDTAKMIAHAEHCRMLTEAVKTAIAEGRADEAMKLLAELVAAGATGIQTARALDKKRAQ